MKLIITKLDNGYILTVTYPAEGEQPERKERLAFEAADTLYQKLDTLIPIPAADGH